MNNKPNFQSLVFTGVLLGLVLFSRSDQDIRNKVSFQEEIKNTSLTASVQPIILASKNSISAKTTPNNNEIDYKSILDSKTEELKPIKKEGVVDPQISSKIIFVKDLDSQKNLYSFGTEKRWPIASISKIMTALIALEKIGSDKIQTISQTALDTEGIAGDLKLNEKYSIKDLVRIMLFVSSNDAAVSISEFYGQDNFIQEMNAKAKELGMTETRFFDCTGLSVINQSNTEDLTKLTQYVLKNRPEIFEFTKTKELSVVELSGNLVKFFTNINYFGGQTDFIGGKTGFIESSEQNLLSLFSYRGHKIFIMILGSGDRFGDTQKILEWVKNSYEF